MVPTSRCTIYRGTFIGACLFSEFRNTSGSGVPSPWITDSDERTRHQRNLYRNRLEKKRKRTVDGMERGERGGRKTKRATAIIVDGQKKKMIVVSTAIHTCIYVSRPRR